MTEPSTSWQNWSGGYTMRPARVAHPASPDDVAAEVRRANDDDLSIKAIGSGHSFTDIGLTRGVLLSLDRLTGIRAADPTTGLVTVAAGTTLHDLNKSLWQLGLAMPNLGDIDRQTISGAISTGTHGTGARLGGIATQVRALQLVTGDGTTIDCSATEHPDVFEHARVGLGALGIITAVTLQCVPAFALHAVESHAPLAQVLDDYEQRITAADHFEFYWFPHTEKVATKANTRLAPGAATEPLGRFRRWFDDELLGNKVWERLNRATTRRPKYIRAQNRLATALLGGREFSDRSYRVFASPRDVKFREMEYAIPRSLLPTAINQIRRWLDMSGTSIGYPLEVRFAAADDIPLSTGFQRDNCYVAVHEYHRRPHEPYFAAVESIMRDLDGRPHWGKLHYRSATDLAPLYPKFDEFVAMRDRLDPERRFGNDYLRRVLGS
jgi:L-gulonolactone oxidase